MLGKFNNLYGNETMSSTLGNMVIYVSSSIQIPDNTSQSKVIQNIPLLHSCNWSNKVKYCPEAHLLIRKYGRWVSWSPAGKVPK